MAENTSSMINRDSLLSFVNVEIGRFHQSRLATLESLTLSKVLQRKNPYLFRAKNITTASDLVTALMDALLSSSEEKIFGDFLENLAVYVSSQACGGRKSSAEGIDLEFDRDNTRYMVSIKSGPSWGNSSQYHALAEAFRRAVAVQKQGHHGLRPQPVLGICYGRQATKDNGIYVRYTGQTFWHFLTGDKDFYLGIIEPIGTDARRYNDDFVGQKARLVNKFTDEFMGNFCTPEYCIDWEKLVEFNSGNMTQSAPTVMEPGSAMR